MSNKEVLDAITALTTKIGDIDTKLDLFIADTKASLSKLEAKKTTRSGGGAKKAAADTTPSGPRFPPNFMTWYRKEYQRDPATALKYVPPPIKEQLEDFKNNGDDKYQKKTAAAKLSSEATFLWRKFDETVKAGIKTAYNEAKAAYDKKQLEPATVEGEGTTATGGDTPAENGEVVVTTRRKTAGTKRAIVVG